MGVAIVLLLITSIISFILYGEIRKWFIQKKLRNFESPKNVPILGVAGHFIGVPNDKLIDVINSIVKDAKTTPVQMWFGPVLTIGVSEPEDIQTVLTSDDCLNKPYFYEQFHCKSSLIVADKEIWKPQRRALNAAFNVKVLQSFIPHFNDKSRILLQRIDEFHDKPCDLYRTIFICMMDIISKTTMGTELSLQSEQGAMLYKTVRMIMANVQYRITRFWLKWDFIYNLSKVGRNEKKPFEEGNKVIEKMYIDKKREIELLKSQGIDHLENVKVQNKANFLEKCLILEQEGMLNTENVMDQMRVIIFAGIDTTSITIFGTLLMLAINQKHQELVIEELQSIFESADCDVTQSHLAAMHYMDRVIKETMRLLPPGPFIGRKPSADIVLRRGTIPKGAMVMINILQLHRNPKIWGKNVYEFDPDRFLPENVAKRPAFSYIPFSGGNRNCIGMKYAMISAKITLAHLLRRYKFTTDLKFADIRVKPHIVLEVANKNPLQIEKRHFQERECE